MQSQAAREEAVRTFANVTEAAAGAEAQMKELETRVDEEEASKSRLATRLKEVE